MGAYHRSWWRHYRGSVRYWAGIVVTSAAVTVLMVGGLLAALNAWMH